MQELVQHQITKNITKSGLTRDYYCKKHNASYPNLPMLKEDHPNLDKNKIISFKKGVRVSAQDYSLTLSLQIKNQPKKREKEFDIQ